MSDIMLDLGLWKVDYEFVTHWNERIGHKQNQAIQKTFNGHDKVFRVTATQIH